MPKSLSEISIRDALNAFKKLDRKAKIKLVSWILGTVFFIIFILDPAWVQRPRIKREIKDLEGKIVSAERQIQLEPQLLADRKKYTAQIEKTMARLLTEGETQRLLGLLANIAEKSQMAVLSSQPQIDVEKIPDPFNQKYLPLSYLITLEGGYHELAHFVSIVESHPKILRVNEFSIEAQEDKPRFHVGEMRLSAFFLREGK